jgi:uncharacterized protein
MIDKAFLNILCCPETKQDLVLIEGEPINLINSRIRDSAVKNRSGQIVKEPLDYGLLREDRKYLYPVREDIPVMLIDEAIPFEGFDK